MKRGKTLLALGLLSSGFLGAQGLLNNGAYIVMSGASQIYVSGATGHYLSQSSGRITPSATGIITIEGNWTNNAGNTGFTADAGTVVMNGAAESINGSASTTFYNLTLQGSGTKTLNVATSVGGVVTTTGVLSMGSRPLDLNSNNLTITNPATGAITYTTGYAISETNSGANPSSITWNMGTVTGSHVYPFGTTTAVQIPLTFNKTTATASNIRIATRPTATSANTPWSTGVTHMYDPTLAQDGSDEAVIDRWWDITATAATNADVTFTYRGLENTMIVPYNTGNVGAQYWASAWLPNNSNIGSSPAVLVGTGAVTASGLSFAAAAFTPMVLSSLAAPLPVEFANVSADCNGNSVLVSWNTASETNNDHFVVERSTDGLSFSDVGNVHTLAPNGFSTSTLHYAFTDMSAVAGATMYYRIRQVDVNGMSDHSGTVVVEPCSTSFHNYVDVIGSGTDVNVTINAELSGDYNAVLYDARGRLVADQKIHAGEGFNSIRLDIGSIETGIYLVTVRSSNGTVFTKRVYLDRQ